MGILVVDSQTGTGAEPTGVAGGIYYNDGGIGGVSGTNGGVFRCFQDNAWRDCLGMPDMSQRRYGYAEITGGTAGTTFSDTGDLFYGGITTAGTSAGTTTNNFVNYATAAGTGDVNGINTGTTAASSGAAISYTTIKTEWEPKVETRLRVDATNGTSSMRVWFSLSSAIMTGSNPVTTSTGFTTAQYIGVGYSTSATPASTWICGASNGTTENGVSTGDAVSAGSYYDIILDYSSRSTLACSVSANGGAYSTVTTTTDLPSSTQALGLTEAVTTLNGTAKNLAVEYMYYENN